MYKHKLLAFWSGVLGLAAVLFLATSTVVNADSTSSTWLAPSPLTLQKQTELLTVPPSLNGNIDCFPDGNYGCVIAAAYGAVQGSQVRLNGTTAYHDILTYIENRPRILAIPNSDSIISYTTEPPYGFYLYFNYNFASSISPVVAYGSTTPQYKINRAPDGKLVDKTNHRLAADYASISYSPNGQWMVVSQPNVAMLRVNLRTFEVVPFGSGFNYTIGLSPSPKTAITNDGRYAVVASSTFGMFKIYDLSTCASVPNTITGPVSCQSRDLQSFMAQQLPGYIGLSAVRFLSNDSLSFYAGYTQNSVRRSAKFVLSTTGGVIHQLDYLALGESYISGEGAFSYQPGTDTVDNRCHLSLVSYPYLMGRDLSYNSYHSVACSGAKISDITSTSDDYKGQADPKVRRQERGNEIPQILGAFKPGYIAQLEFAGLYQPKTITVSIGGNDIGFSDIVLKCAGFWNLDNCFESYEDRLELVRQINSKFPMLVDTYTKLKNQSAPDTKIYVIGYPQIVKAGGDCGLNVRFSDSEAAFAQMLTDYLNAVIKAAADRVGVFYVDVQDAFNQHRLCEAGPGSVAVNGLTAGHDAPDWFNGLVRVIGNESFHPNDFGHMLLENKVLAATHNLTDPMPSPNSAAAPPTEIGLEILNVSHEGRAINKTFYNGELASDVIIKNYPTDISVNGLDYSLKPGASYRVELHTEPQVLGIHVAAVSGNLFAQVQIPDTTPTGFHTLHVYGTNLANEPIDIYKTVYIASSKDDIDGDGVGNASDPCVFIEPAGKDYDQDGIDDACDGVIGEAPPPVIPAAVEPTPITEITEIILQPALLPSIGAPAGSAINTAGDSQGSLTLSSSQDNKVALGLVATTESLGYNAAVTNSTDNSQSAISSSTDNFFSSYYSTAAQLSNTAVDSPPSAPKVLSTQTNAPTADKNPITKNLTWSIVAILGVFSGTLLVRRAGL